MAEEQRGIDGAQKAAIFLMAVGEGPAAEVMKHLGPREVQKIGFAMSGLEVVSPQNVKSTLGEFVKSVQTHTGIGIGSEEYIRKVLNDALGVEKAGNMIDRIMLGGSTKGLESLKWMDPRTIVEMVQFEHPQIVAIVLSYLDSDQSAEVLSLLPENTRSDLLMRIATMDSVQPAAMKELNEMLEIQLRDGGAGSQSTLGGIKCAADIMNYVERGVEAKINEQIVEVDADMAERIQDLMFTFENIVDIDDRGVQTLLREVSTENLVLALKGTDDAIQDKVFGNMSQRAADMLRDDLEAKGPVKVSEVEAAQKEILGIARRLADEGQISLGGGSEDMI
jgi:flagellar motor switch protein FliG